MKRKNNISICFILSILIGIITSCDDFLNTLPDSRAELDTESKITSLLVSAYPTRYPVLLTELASDNTMDNGKLYTFLSDTPEQETAYLWEDILTTGNDSPDNLWKNCYSAIAAANHALEAIEEMGSPESLNPQKAEALLCRAFSHFILVNVFCLHYNSVSSETDMGIPYATEPETEVFVNYERGTVADVYKKINQDIEDALPLVDDKIFTIPKYHFNTAAAYAFATRFNLFYGNYDKVIEYANKVLGEDPKGKLRDFAPIATMSDPTEISNTWIAADAKTNLLILPVYSSWPYVYGPWSLGERYGQAREICVNEINRAPGPWGVFQNFYQGTRIWNPEQKFPFPKFDMYFEYTDKTGRTGFRHMVIPVFTVDKTLLCRAEAYIHKNDYDKATQDLADWMESHCLPAVPRLTRSLINSFYEEIEPMETVAMGDERTIKKELNPKGFTITEGEQENFFHCLLHFRRLETVHEGFRWYDVKRFGIEIAHNRDGLPTDILTVDDPRRAMQLPQDVINAGLPANPR